MADREPQKERDVGQIVRYLVSTYQKAVHGQDRAVRTQRAGPNQAYLWEREFAYRLNEIVQGPKCMIQPNIMACNEFIDTVIGHIKQQAA